MCSGSHGQTAGTCREKKKSCPKCGSAKLMKVRRAVVEPRWTGPDEMVWNCLICNWYKPVE